MTFWTRREHALALLELLRSGELRVRKAQAEALSELQRLRWVRRTGRRGRFALDPAARVVVEQTLDKCWPPWRDVAARLQRSGLPPTARGLAELEGQERFEDARTLDLSSQLNRRTLSAALGRHAKAALGPFERVVLDEVDVTHDGLVRLRPNPGLTVQSADGRELDAMELVALQGEVVLTDRALRAGTRLAGVLPRVVLTVENLGAFQDAWAPTDVLVAYMPGWNTRTVRDLLDGLGQIPVVHFGDLDPNGLAIVVHLRNWRADVGWLIPAFWHELVESHGLDRTWPETAYPTDAPSWVRGLAGRSLWLEQERVVVDPRWQSSVEADLAGFIQSR